MGIINDKEEFERIWQRHKKSSSIDPCNGTFAGQLIDLETNELVNVFMNPITLDNFEANVRGISDENGNLFLAQLDGNFLHVHLAEAVNAGSTGCKLSIAYQKPYSWYVKHNIIWHRMMHRNIFGLSISYSNHMSNDYNTDIEMQTMLKNIGEKNPKMRFILEYWCKIKIWKTDTYNGVLSSN